VVTRTFVEILEPDEIASVTEDRIMGEDEVPPVTTNIDLDTVCALPTGGRPRRP